MSSSPAKANPVIDFDAIEAANRPLGAFTDFDRGATFGEGPLAGVTVGVKSNIAVAGLPWTAGMELHRYRVAQRDAETVAALRGAGAAILGSLNMEEAALGAKTDNPFYGRTYNPHRTGFTPGGSSGGSGAAVAAGLCDIALGTDTMGSVRIPASYCGVYGFKPAQTAVSRDGLEIAEPFLDVIGPLARSLDMLEKTARITSKFGDAPLSGTVVTLEGLAGVECTPDVLAAFERACGILGVSQTVALTDTPSRIRYAGFIATARALDAALKGAPEGSVSDTLSRLIGYGPRRQPDDLGDDGMILTRAAGELNAIVQDKGVLVLPTAPQTAFSHDDPAPANQADFTCLANVANLPAITVPAGMSDQGLPIGIQLVGPRGSEAALFELARQLDTHLAGYRQPTHFFQG